MTGAAGTPEPEFRLLPLSPAEATASWDNLLPWVEAVRRRTRPGWRSEDVYCELKAGRATAFLALLQKRPKGLLVLVDRNDVILGRRELAMWIAYSEDPRTIDLVLDEVENMARAGGFSAITGASPRKGWLRRLAKRGYNLVAYQFEKGLQ